MENRSLEYSLVLTLLINANILTIPHSFEQSGCFLSILYLILLCILSYYLTQMMIEIIYKAQCIKNWQEGEEGRQFKIKDIVCNTDIDSLAISTNEICEIKSDTMNFVTILFGKPLGLLYSIILTIIYQSLLIHYFSLFSKTFIYNITVSHWDACDIYQETDFFSPCGIYYMILLTVLLGYTSCYMYTGIKNQKRMQIICLLLKVIIIIIVIIGSIEIIFWRSTPSTGEFRPFEAPKWFDIIQSNHILTSGFSLILIQPLIPVILNISAPGLSYNKIIGISIFFFVYLQVH